eukprot:147368-Prorocentrum_minimum.AAC.1
MVIGASNAHTHRPRGDRARGDGTSSTVTIPLNIPSHATHSSTDYELSHDRTTLHATVISVRFHVMYVYSKVDNKENAVALHSQSAPVGLSPTAQTFQEILPPTSHFSELHLMSTRFPTELQLVQRWRLPAKIIRNIPSLASAPKIYPDIRVPAFKDGK